MNCKQCGRTLKNERANKEFCGKAEGDKNGKCRANYHYKTQSVKKTVKRKLTECKGRACLKTCMESVKFIGKGSVKCRDIRKNVKLNRRISPETVKNPPEPKNPIPRIPTDTPLITSMTNQRFHNLLFEFFYLNDINTDYIYDKLRENNIPCKQSQMHNWNGIYAEYNPIHDHHFTFFFTTRGLIVQPDPYKHDDISLIIDRVKEDLQIIHSFFAYTLDGLTLSEDIHILKRIENAFEGNEIAQEAQKRGIEPITIHLDTGEVLRLFWDMSMGEIELELETESFEGQELGSGNIKKNMQLIVHNDLTPLVDVPEQLGGLHSDMTIIGENFGKVAEVMEDFGKYTKSHVEVMKGGAELVKAIIRATEVFEGKTRNRRPREDGPEDYIKRIFRDVR